MLYLVIHYKNGEGSAFELGGLFDDEALAVAACHTPRDLVQPMVLNRAYPAASTMDREIFDAAYFPLAQAV